MSDSSYLEVVLPEIMEDKYIVRTYTNDNNDDWKMKTGEVSDFEAVKKMTRDMGTAMATLRRLSTVK